MIAAAEGRVRVETRKTLSSFVIEGAERSDEGPYTITVTNPAGEDKAEVFVKVVGQWLLLFLVYLHPTVPIDSRAVCHRFHSPFVSFFSVTPLLSFHL